MSRSIIKTVFTLLLILFAACAHAQHYKWQDPQGQWHFSDRPPADGSRFETIGLPREPRSMVSARRGGEQHRPRHYFFNHYHGPAQIELRLTEAQNVVSSPPLPARFVIPGDSELGLVQFGPRDPSQPFSYRLAYSLVPGAPSAELPDDLAFYPPFARDRRFPISQGLDDAQTHQDAANRYAVDIVMPIGTPVFAARGGVVMDSEQQYPDTGREEERYLDQANFVRIAHDDGTMAVYAHLQRDSLRVVPGMRVPAGHWIANSGNSGYSSGPHLHFVIQMNIDMALESLPISFRRPDGGVMDPDRPQMLSGVLPGAR
jgi:murein DD-endopeptidase MepM/ murein hydrolase activator NlpD